MNPSAFFTVADEVALCQPLFCLIKTIIHSPLKLPDYLTSSRKRQDKSYLSPLTAVKGVKAQS